MIHIICIKWGNLYSPDYVNNLYSSIKRNSSKEFLFSCFTDNEQGIISEIDIRPLPINLNTWFNKIALYNKDLYNKGDQIFFIDLDTVIVGNIDNILSYSGDFIILRDFYRKTGLQSAFMSFAPDAVNFMWERFTPGTTCKNGDQGWPEIHYPHADIWQHEYPDSFVSYKVHCIKTLPKQASVVCYHGNPRPHTMSEIPWMKQHWRI